MWGHGVSAEEVRADATGRQSRAIDTGDIGGVRAALEAGASVGKVAVPGTGVLSPILRVVRNTRPYAPGTVSALIRELVDHGADANERGGDGKTPLRCVLLMLPPRPPAVFAEVMSALLSAGASAWDEDTQTSILHVAMPAARYNTCLFAMQATGTLAPELERRNARGQTPLISQAICHHALANDDARAIVRMLLSRGAVARAADCGGYTAGHYAAVAGDEDLLMMLMDHGLSIDARTAEGLSVLDLVAPETEASI
jgi:ankyrin repeat protein